MARGGKIPAVKIEPGKNHKTIIRVPLHRKTTEIYTHVSTKNLGKIVSPIDTLNLKGGG